MDKDFREIARQSGIEFEGMGESLHGFIPIFTDPETGSTFALFLGETVESALRRVRKLFQSVGESHV